MADARDMIATEVARLFRAFPRSNQEFAESYARALRGTDIEKIQKAVDWTIDHWDKTTPPPIASFKTKASGQELRDDTADRERLKQLRYYLEHYSDEDQHQFNRAFGFIPTAETFQKFDLRIPNHVRFERIDEGRCEEEREVAREACSDAFNRAEGGVLGQRSERVDEGPQWWNR